jgi:hypothetical protein
MFDFHTALALEEKAGSPWMSMTRTTTKTVPTMIRRMEMSTDRRERRKDNAFSVRVTLHAASALRGANILLGIFESILENDLSSVIAAGAFHALITFVSTPRPFISMKRYLLTPLLLLALASNVRYARIEFAQPVDLELAR